MMLLADFLFPCCCCFVFFLLFFFVCFLCFFFVFFGGGGLGGVIIFSQSFHVDFGHDTFVLHASVEGYLKTLEDFEY